MGYNDVMNIADIISNQAYSVQASGKTAQAGEMYEGRERITSATESVQGKVYYPKLMEGHIEAISVDYLKDKPLAEYITEVEEHISRIAATYKAKKLELDFEKVAGIICAKIKSDFPYAHHMTDKTWRAGHYENGIKYRLSAFMKGQDMVCRHHTALAAAILDHMKEKGNLVKEKCHVRMTADIETDPEERSGHAYVVVKYRNKKTDEIEYFVLDPTAGRARKVPKQFKAIDARSYRYLFSLLRVLFQMNQIEDDSFLHMVFNHAKTDDRLKNLLSDIEKTIKGDPAAMVRFSKLLLLVASKPK